MDLNERRAELGITGNSNSSTDYIVSFKLSLPDSTIDVHIKYIPDKAVILSNALPAYARALSQCGYSTIEKLANIILDDINNEAVPRWVQVTINHTNTNQIEHSIVIEDKQPQWDNPHLMARMSGI